MPLPVLIALGLLGAFLLWHGTRAERTAAELDPDQATLNALAGAGAPLEQTHTIEFYLYFPTRSAAAAAATSLGEDGFTCRLEQVEDSSDWLCLAGRRMVPEWTALHHLRDRLRRLAEAGEGVYDGWGAVVELADSTGP